MILSLIYHASTCVYYIGKASKVVVVSILIFSYWFSYQSMVPLRIITHFQNPSSLPSKYVLLDDLIFSVSFVKLKLYDEVIPLSYFDYMSHISLLGFSLFYYIDCELLGCILDCFLLLRCWLAISHFDFRCLSICRRGVLHFS